MSNDTLTSINDEGADGRQPITEEMGIHKEWYAARPTLAELPEFLRKLTEDYGHDYGTICHAIAAGALAAARAINGSPQGGITGFQAGAIMWQFISEWMGKQGQPMRLVDYGDLLYPQYLDKFKTISADTWEWMQAQAKERLTEVEGAHPEVRSHWQAIADGNVPAGFAVSD